MLVLAAWSGDSVGTGAGAGGGFGREAQQDPVTQGGHVSLQPWLRVAPRDRSESRGARDGQRGDSRACPFWNEWHRRDPCAVPALGWVWEHSPIPTKGSSQFHPGASLVPAHRSSPAMKFLFFLCKSHDQLSNKLLCGANWEV